MGNLVGGVSGLADEPMEEAEDEEDAFYDSSLDRDEEMDPDIQTEMAAEVDLDSVEAPSMSALRQAAARSFTSVPNTTEDATGLADAYQLVELLTQQQRYAEALNELEPFRRSMTPDVLLDVAWHRGNLYWRMNQTASALRAIDEGMQVIGGDNRLRARLLYLKGQLLESAGDVTGAIAAYTEAATR